MHKVQSLRSLLRSEETISEWEAFEKVRKNIFPYTYPKPPDLYPRFTENNTNLFGTIAFVEDKG